MNCAGCQRGTAVEQGETALLWGPDPSGAETEGFGAVGE